MQAITASADVFNSSIIFISAQAVMVGSEDETGAHDPHSEKNNENDFFNHSTSGEARLGASMMMGE